MTKANQTADTAKTADTAADKPAETKVETGKTYYATRDFKDAGTERQFVGGEPIEQATDGELLNYAAAGLASTEKPKADDVEA